MDREPIVDAPEPHKQNFVGLLVEFDLHRTSGRITREKGEVIDQRWLGLTQRGRIPEYELTIRGLRSNASVYARVTEDHVWPI